MRIRRLACVLLAGALPALVGFEEGTDPAAGRKRIDGTGWPKGP